jgi:hypothetical protein
MIGLEFASPDMGWALKTEEEMEQLLSLLPTPEEQDNDAAGLDSLIQWPTATGLTVF